VRTTPGSPMDLQTLPTSLSFSPVPLYRVVSWALSVCALRDVLRAHYSLLAHGVSIIVYLTPSLSVPLSVGAQSPVQWQLRHHSYSSCVVYYTSNGSHHCLNECSICAHV
jgi:hypothetical protein